MVKYSLQRTVRGILFMVGVMNFFEHLDSEFAYSKKAFLYAINGLPESKTIVINLGMSSLSYNTGLLNIRTFKNFISDVSELVNANSKRQVVIVLSDSLEKTKHQYLLGNDNPSTNSGLYSALITLVHRDIVNVFCDGFANFNLRAIGFSISSVGADAAGELNRTLNAIERIISSKTNSDANKIKSVRELLEKKKSITKTANFNVTAKRTAETLNGLFRNFPRTVPILMEDISYKDNQIEEGDVFAAKIAIALNADVMLSISRKGMLYTVDPEKSGRALPFYCFDTGRGEPFNEARKAALAKKLNAAKHVNAHNKPIPLVLTSYNNPYTICNIFDKNTITGICQNGNYPAFTLFTNSRNPSLPIEARHIVGSVTIDGNAEKALVNDKRSLLQVGVVSVEGDFEAKSVVAILNKNSEEIGKGIVEYGSSEIRREIETRNSADSAKTKDSVVVSRSKMRLQ